MLYLFVELNMYNCRNCSDENRFLWQTLRDYASNCGPMETRC
uniref:Uncharacterized protein n=1 Tax=Anguilla anguilla TaxID=7936 RepID=A0A0E9RA85_ANGAN